MSSRSRDSDPALASRSTVGYFFREALRRIWISRKTSFVSIAMIAIALVILGAFLLLAENLDRAVGRWQQRSRLTIYLKTDAPGEQVRSLQQELDAFPAFSTRTMVDRDEALRRFKTSFRDLGGIVDELDQSPFPPSIEVEIPAHFHGSLELSRRIASIRGHAAVEDVQFDWDWIVRMRKLVDAINLAGWIAGGILALAAIFTIANVIRLTMVLYREEIDIMRLVGATERIIRGPFLVEGLMQGLFGGVLAIAILWGAFLAGERAIGPGSALLWSFLFTTFLPWPKILMLVGGGIFAGFIGSWISVREWSEEKPTG
ncbi:MAG TPA: permease-like cell division protein FtsX [Thermoanaerobaculia bacterium]|nr:permease-like cell division protein FtsX [Thermoanaerobaculia bacterium]